MKPKFLASAALCALALSVPVIAPAADQKMTADQAAVTVGEMEIANPFTRATMPNQPAGGGFLTITNKGSEGDRLIAVSSSVAERAEIHQMTMVGEVMKMRELPDGLPIPAGETVELKPGGYHLMFMGLNQPFVEGESIAVTLTFEKAGKVDVKLMVGSRTAQGHQMGQNG